MPTGNATRRPGVEIEDLQGENAHTHTHTHTLHTRTPLRTLLHPSAHSRSRARPSTANPSLSEHTGLGVSFSHVRLLALLRRLRRGECTGDRAADDPLLVRGHFALAGLAQEVEETDAPPVVPVPVAAAPHLAGRCVAAARAWVRELWTGRHARHKRASGRAVFGAHRRRPRCCRQRGRGAHRSPPGQPAQAQPARARLCAASSRCCVWVPLNVEAHCNTTATPHEPMQKPALLLLCQLALGGGSQTRTRGRARPAHQSRPAHVPRRAPRRTARPRHARRAPPLTQTTTPRTVRSDVPGGAGAGPRPARGCRPVAGSLRAAGCAGSAGVCTRGF